MSERAKEIFKEVWHPSDKDFPKVYTTEGKVKYTLYENHAELATSINLNEPCDFVWEWTQTKKRGIVNLYTGSTPLLPEEAPKAPVKPDKFGEGQREGMAWKEIGLLIRDGKIVNIFGKENAMSITKEYRAYLLATLRLAHDGAKLPQWEDKQE